MVLNRAIAIILALAALSVPCSAAERSVHLFGGTYRFDFSRDFVFTKRVESDAGKRQTVTFTNANTSIVMSAIRSESGMTEPLIAQEVFLARVAAEGGSETKYLNEIKRNGRRGSYVIGFCKKDSCLYRMAGAVDRKYWMSILVLCEKCVPPQTAETRKLAEQLYQQLKTF